MVNVRDDDRIKRWIVLMKNRDTILSNFKIVILK